MSRDQNGVLRPGPASSVEEYSLQNILASRDRSLSPHCTPGFFARNFTSDNVWHWVLAKCCQRSCNLKNPRNEEELLRYFHWVKVNIAQTNWPISFLLCYTTDQLQASCWQCNIDPKAKWEETWYKWAPNSAGVRVWNKNRDGGKEERKKMVCLNLREVNSIDVLNTHKFSYVS